MRDGIDLQEWRLRPKRNHRKEELSFEASVCFHLRTRSRKLDNEQFASRFIMCARCASWFIYGSGIAKLLLFENSVSFLALHFFLCLPALTWIKELMKKIEKSHVSLIWMLTWASVYHLWLSAWMDATIALSSLPVSTFFEKRKKNSANHERLNWPLCALSGVGRQVEDTAGTAVFPLQTLIGKTFSPGVTTKSSAGQRTRPHHEERHCQRNWRAVGKHLSRCRLRLCLWRRPSAFKIKRERSGERENSKENYVTLASQISLRFNERTTSLNIAAESSIPNFVKLYRGSKGECAKSFSLATGSVWRQNWKI